MSFKIQCNKTIIFYIMVNIELFTKLYYCVSDKIFNKMNEKNIRVVIYYQLQVKKNSV